MKPKLKSAIVSLIALFSFVNVFSQKILQKEFLKTEGTISFVRFESGDPKASLSNVKDLLKEILSLKTDDELRLKKETSDVLGFIYQYYLQYYKGMPVEKMVYSVHSKNGSIETINGDLAKIDLDFPKDLIDIPMALQFALKYVNARRYKWQEMGNDQLPSGELVIVKGLLRLNPIYRLAYKFEIAATEPLNSMVVYVDAENGDVIHKESLVCNFRANEHVQRAVLETAKEEVCNASILPFSNSPGTAETVYSGTVNIVGDSYAGGYRLNETTNGVFIATRQFNNPSPPYNTPNDFSDNDNNWTAAEHGANKDIYATDAHWGQEQFYNYFLTKHNRNSIDNAGLPILGYAHFAGWEGYGGWSNGDNYAFYGDDDATHKVMTALDVVAHEFGHGVTKFNRSNPSVAGLTGYGETKSISEGMSDIWSVCIENYAMPSRPIWLLGDQLFKNSSITCERNMQNPKDPNCNFVMADCYGGTNWINPSTDPYDNIMWYRNCGVFTHWFYILSVGKTGTNDLNHSYQVPGIGITDAEKIIYRALTTYFTPSINFAGVRDATITSAIDLFGQNSCYVKDVTNAWYAVGVGPAYSGNLYPINGDNNFCFTSNNYTIPNLPVGATVQWQVSPQGVVTINSPNSPQTTLTKNSNGIITLTAVISNACGGQITVIKDNITVGAPVTIQTTNQGCGGVYQTWLLSAVPTTNGSNWYWSVSYLGNNSQITIYSPGSPSTQVSVKGGGGVNLNFTDACGVAQQYGVTVYSSCGYGGYSYRVSASPNPAKSSLNVNFTPITEANTSNADTTSTAPLHQMESKGKTIMSLYEVNTTLLVRQWKYSETENNNYNLNVNGLRKGIYVLQVDRENQTKTIKIIIE